MTSITPEEVAKLAAEEKVQRMIGLMRQLSTSDGFFMYYFNLLPECESPGKAFNKANEVYMSLFGRYKYSSHESFLNVTRNRKKLK